MENKIQEVIALLERVNSQQSISFAVERVPNLKAHALDCKILDCLTPREREVTTRIRSQKRRAEFLAGRIAAKRALSQKTGLTQDIEILRASSGAPLIIPDYSSLFLSISHSHEVALAVVAEAPIGVDLERIEARHDSLLNYYFAAEEHEYIDRIYQNSTDLGITLLWTAKEAVSKCLGKGGSLSFKELLCHKESLQTTFAPKGITLYKEAGSRFCLSCAIQNREDIVDG